MFGKLVLCEDAVKELSPCCELKEVFCARLEASINLDLKGVSYETRRAQGEGETVDVYEAGYFLGTECQYIVV